MTYVLTRNVSSSFSITASSLYDIFAYLSPQVDKRQDYADDSTDIAGHRGGISVGAMIDKANSNRECVDILINCKELKGKYTLHEL